MKLTDFLKPYKLNIFLAPFFKLLEAIIELLTPIVVARIIDIGIANKDTDFIIKYGLLMIGLAVLGFIFALVCQYVASITSQKVGTDLRNAMMVNYLDYPMSKSDKIDPSAFNSRIVNDTQNLQLTVAMSLRLLTRAPFLVIGSTVAAFLVNYTLAPIFLVCTFLIGVVIYFVMTKSAKLFLKASEGSDRLIGKVRENVNGARIVRASNKTDDELERASVDVNFIRKQVLNANKIGAFLNPLTFLIINSAIVLLILLGKEQILKGNLVVGELLALISYMTQILLSLLVIAYLATIMSRASASAKRVRPLIQPFLGEKSDKFDVFDEKSDTILEFKNVSFKYDGMSKYSIKDISFTLKEGKSLGIVGSTASGKTTLVNLLGVLYKPSEGQILLNGSDIKTLNPNKIHQIISIAPQNANLFAGMTVKENINWRDKNASDEEIFKALESAAAKEFVLGKENGLDEVVAGGGKNFSGGQRQRLSLCRAFLGGFKLLILDDSYSALDALTTGKVNSAVNGMNTAKIIVSQRTQAVMNLDNILVLDDGEAVGYGTHNELLKDCKVYREIHQSLTVGQNG